MLIKEKLLKFRKIIILASLLFLFGLILGLANIEKVQEKKEVILLPSPPPTPVEKEIISPSIYATDSAILAIEEKLEVIEKDLLETDLYETGLNPPVLDMEVEFKE